jgi:hypothetical protein
MYMRLLRHRIAFVHAEIHEILSKRLSFIYTCIFLICYGKYIIKNFLQQRAGHHLVGFIYGIPGAGNIITSPQEPHSPVIPTRSATAGHPPPDAGLLAAVGHRLSSSGSSSVLCRLPPLVLEPPPVIAEISP